MNLIKLLPKSGFAIWCALIFGGASLFGQQITGTVTDTGGVPLLGVNVVVTGSQVGTVTDFDGNYSIAAPEGSQSLTFSMIGFETQTVAIDGRTQIDMVLGQNIRALDEVIITGYSSQQRRDVTASIVSADVESLQKRGVTNAAQALQGTAAGVHIISNNGNPGSDVNITIRGVSSFGGNNSPLIIVDGVQTESGMNNINQNDIESVQILKDASAAAIYGSRGANGVILIKTKTGIRGKTTVTYSNYLGTQIPRKPLDLVNSSEYIQILQRMYGTNLDNNPDALIPQAAIDYLANPAGFGDYDWQDIIYSSAPMQFHDLSISGGSESAIFRVSASYLDQEGITVGTAFNRANIRANGLFNINDHIRLGANIALYRSKQDPEADAFSRSIYQQAIKLKPYFAPTFNGSGVANPAFPDTNPDGDIQTSSFYFGGGDNPEALIRNPLHYLTIWDTDIIEDEVSVNLYTEIDIIKGLTYKLSGAYSQLTNENRYLFGFKGVNQDEYFNDNNAINISTSRDWNWNVDNTLRYSGTIGEKHDIDVLAGFVAQKFSSTARSFGKNNFLADVATGINTLGAPGGANPSVSGQRFVSTLASIVAQASYSFDDRYLLSANFRRDGSSRFSSDVRWGNFAGGSLGWKISNEEFWDKAGLSDINFLKLRAGYGILGRQNVPEFAFLPTLQFEPVVFGAGVANGLITGTAINPNVTWEKLESTNIGMDFELFNSWSGSFEYYNNITTDMIIAAPIAPSAGGGTINQNNGKITNNGIELSLNYEGSAGDDFTYNVGFNVGTQNPKLDNIGTDLIIYGDAGPEWDVPHVMEVHQGGGLSEFWVIKTDGIFRTADEVSAHRSSNGTIIQPDAQPGDIRFVDANDDGAITSEGDRQLAGSGVPNVNAGFNFSAKYKNFDFNLILTGAFGHQIYNSHLYLVSKTDEFGNYGRHLLNAFDPVDNPNSNIPRLNPNDIDENWNSRPQSDRFIENGDYVKLRNFEIGYTLPKALANKLYMGNARIFVRGQNLWTITGFGGLDPEVGSSPILAGFTPFTAGLDRDTAPQAASIQAGVSITF
ncbi:SusC/RagA family TonB-linked outer membrane protein [Flagellimonas algicola]|uniref:TonB-dependent receptor n=1 Tax=Flagellimonas algicola TaxID=2583815 RepID=A0ABY2WIR4_9FLAO|nr:TonB-dependent receptor [Allomuricauda algicola]TMU54603.1 TonB-dependent receptor [Allomuricauda algicola]